jgi:nickel transport protein
VPKTGVAGAIKSWLSEESVKRIDRWTPGADRPLSDGLEITPTVEPLALKPGDKLVVLVTEGGKSRAGVPVAYGDDVRGTTGEDGRIAIRLRHGGTQLIAASVETPLADGKADVAIRSAILQFEIAK